MIHTTRDSDFYGLALSANREAVSMACRLPQYFAVLFLASLVMLLLLTTRTMFSGLPRVVPSRRNEDLVYANTFTGLGNSESLDDADNQTSPESHNPAPESWHSSGTTTPEDAHSSDQSSQREEITPAMHSESPGALIDRDNLIATTHSTPLGDSSSPEVHSEHRTLSIFMLPKTSRPSMPPQITPSQNPVGNGTQSSEGAMPGNITDSMCKGVWHNPYRGEDGWTTLEKALEEYKHFHKKKMAVLRDGPREDALKVRTLTWSCDDPVSCCGLGDQMYRMEIALLLAMMSDRVFTMHWNPSNYNTMKYVRPHEIDWSFFDKNLGMREGPSLEKCGKTSQQPYVNLAKVLFSPEPHITMTTTLMVPFWRTYTPCARIGDLRRGFEKLGVVSILEKHSRSVAMKYEVGSFFSGALLRYLFVVTDEVLSEVNKLEVALGLHKKDYVGIHLRTGFVGLKFQENHKRAYTDTGSWKATFACSLRLAESRLGPGAPVYLSADSYIAKQVAVSEFGNRIKVVDMVLQHVALTNSHTTSLVSISNSTNSSVVSYSGDRFMTTWVDFLFLARSHFIIRGDSGFSITIGHYCSFPSERVRGYHC